MLVILGGTDGGFPVLEGLLGNFRTIPVGDLPLSGEDWRIALRLLTGSLEITLRTALPVLAAMTIIDWCQLLVTRAAPTSPAGVLSGAVKPLLGLAVLVATFGGGCEAVVDGVRWRLAGV
jgi:type III secretory pathway component EscT